MSKQEVERLFSKLNENVPKANEAERREPEELLHTKSNLTPYKHNQAWPGRNYFLVGNSYNVDRRLVDTKYATRRTACIAVVLERGRDNRKCVSIEDALTFSGFMECLSRFELAWLSKEPGSTLIGPAFDYNGELIPEAFAVWRREETFHTTRRKKQLALRSN